MADGKKLKVEFATESGKDSVGVTIKRGSRFVLRGNLKGVDALCFMGYVLANNLTDEKLEAHARNCGLEPPLR